jgi:hypothetical protein
MVVAPFFIIILALIGLEIYAINGDQETALWICGLAVGASVVLMPIAYWIFSPASRKKDQYSRPTRGVFVDKQLAQIRGHSQR